MALSYKARKRLSILLLVVWMPAYVVIVVSLMNSIARLPTLVEFLAYAVLGILWALPFRAVFRGVGQADPGEAPPDVPPKGPPRDPG